MPQPIDPSSELGRLTAAERVQQLMERTAQLQHLRSAEIAGQDTQRQQEQVLQAEQKHPEVDNELKRRNPFMGRRRKKQSDAEQEHFETYNAHQQRELPDEDVHGLDVTL